MTIRAQIAQENGISQGRVSQLTKEGMPVTSVEEATLWIKTHLRRSAPLNATIPIAAQGDPFAEAVTRADRARAAERYASAVVREASVTNDLRLTARALRDYLDISKRAAECELVAADAGRATKGLIHERDIVEQYDSVIRPFLHRCHQAATVKGCEWYLTADSAAHEMKSTLDNFFRRLTPRAVFAPNENAKN